MERVETATGIRETMGNAVDCPRLRMDDGRSIAVFRLPASIKLGTRLKVTGIFVNPTTCMGPALRADTIEIL